MVTRGKSYLDPECSTERASEDSPVLRLRRTLPGRPECAQALPDNGPGALQAHPRQQRTVRSTAEAARGQRRGGTVMRSLSPIGIDAGEALTSYSRGATEITEVVIHESVTVSREATVKVLKARNLGVHYIVDRDGSVTQHAPLARQCAHASSPHNVRSVALEIVNPYYGNRALEGQPTIEAVWAHKGVYTLPTLGQLEAAWDTLGVILAACPKIKLEFPGAAGDGFTWGRFPWHKTDPSKRPGGVSAHARWDHADGLFIEYYFACRARGHDPISAYAHTLLAASSQRRRTTLPPPTASLG